MYSICMLDFHWLLDSPAIDDIGKWIEWDDDSPLVGKRLLTIGARYTRDWAKWTETISSLVCLLIGDRFYQDDSIIVFYLLFYILTSYLPYACWAHIHNLPTKYKGQEIIRYYMSRLADGWYRAVHYLTPGDRRESDVVRFRVVRLKKWGGYSQWNARGVTRLLETGQRLQIRDVWNRQEKKKKKSRSKSEEEEGNVKIRV